MKLEKNGVSLHLWEMLCPLWGEAPKFDSKKDEEEFRRLCEAEGTSQKLSALANFELTGPATHPGEIEAAVAKAAEDLASLVFRAIYALDNTTDALLKCRGALLEKGHGDLSDEDEAAIHTLCNDITDSTADIRRGAVKHANLLATEAKNAAQNGDLALLSLRSVGRILQQLGI